MYSRMEIVFTTVINRNKGSLKKASEDFNSSSQQQEVE